MTIIFFLLHRHGSKIEARIYLHAARSLQITFSVRLSNMAVSSLSTYRSTERLLLIEVNDLNLYFRYTTDADEKAKLELMSGTTAEGWQ